MNARMADLISALPDDLEPLPQSTDRTLEQMLAAAGRRAVPTGRIHRLWILGTLQARIAAAYTAAWLRQWYAGRNERDKAFNEAHLTAALKLIGGMSYLRGAVMKVGQMFANYPDIVPIEFANVFGRLYFEAPPMHFAMLREWVRRELGDDPENVFEHFETEAFAAASLGQVHRARLKGSGRPVAVKIQYPGIGRAIRDDWRNLRSLAFPMRMTEHWDNLNAQFDEIIRMLEIETDYEQEALNLAAARSAFREDERIVVPQAYPEFSTRRILTMDLIEGVHLDRYMAGAPSQDERDDFGRRIALSGFRLSYGKNIAYADPQPGNYIFMQDGRLGLIDFGCCLHYSADDIAYMTKIEQAARDSDEATRAIMHIGLALPADARIDADWMQSVIDWCNWIWEPLRYDGAFDFGTSDYMQRGMAMYKDLVRKRRVRSRPVNTWLNRSFVGIRAMLHHLKARVNFKAIADSETTVHV